LGFDHKVVMITGGAQGIGAAAAKAFTERGAAIVIADLDAELGQTLAGELNVAGGRAMAVTCNVADPASIESCVAEARAEIGEIDILINCAALHNFTWGQPTLKLGADRWRQLLDVNVVGIVNAVTAVHPSMRANGGGVIVNMSSINSFVGLTAYGVSKLAVRGLTTAMATELAPDNIRVVGLAPGMIDTPLVMAELPEMHKDALINKLQLIKRQGTRADVVNAFLFLCSDEASFITGETLIVGGGHPLRV
jgi:NAD(P)-dependent dehydrogenase (short-subunit alcohol dehydrogenase family)